MTTSFGNTLNAENAVKRSLADFPKTKIAKLLSGNFLLPFFEERAAHVEATPFGKPWNSLDRLLRSGLYSEAFRRKDHKRLRKFLSNYWGNEAKNFHDDTQDRFERMFLQHDIAVIEALEEQMKSSSFEQLYEIGCGGGQVIEHLCKRLISLKQFMGIDLGEEQIAQNRKHHNHAKLTFETADASEWLPKHASPNSIFLTNGGVFEYFLQDDLEVLFRMIASERKPAAVVVIETIGSDHDLETEKDSLIYGREMSFSHNYPHLLREAGFEIMHQSERPGYEIDGGGRWLRVLAIVK